MKGFRRAVACIWAVVLATPPAVAVADASSPPLAHRDLILQGIRHNLEGDFVAAERVWRELRERDPTHPAGPVFQVSTLWWHQMFDENDTPSFHYKLKL